MSNKRLTIIVRKEGRITIPKTLREKLLIDGITPLEVSLNGKSIKLMKRE